MSESTNEIEHDYTAEIVCPYCGYEHSDSWELRSESDVVECGSCDKKFNYVRNITIDYCTSKCEDSNE